MLQSLFKWCSRISLPQDNASYKTVSMMISSSNTLCAGKVTMKFACLPLTCVEVAVYGCRCYKEASNIHREQMLSFTVGVSRGFWWNKLKWSTSNSVFHVNSSNPYTKHYQRSFWLEDTSRYSFNIINYQFVHLNASKTTSILKRSFDLTTASTESDRDLKALPELRSLSYLSW